MTSRHGRTTKRRVEGAIEMGAIHRETRGEGRGLHEWDYVPFSEERVVKE